MAITVTELVSSRETAGGSTTLHYVVKGTSSLPTARGALLSSAPTTFDGGYREATPSLKPRWVDTVADEGSWTCSIRYKPAPSSIGSVRIRGTTKGGRRHVAVSLATRAYGAGAADNDNNKLIGVNERGYAEGIDIEDSVWNFSVTKVFDSASLPSLASIHALGAPAHVNNADVTFTDTESGLSFTFSAEEVKFLGVDFGELYDDGGMPFVYEFAASLNAVDFPMGGITGIAKTGWEYPWLRQETTETGPPLNVLTAISKAVYVERIYPLGDYSILDL